MLWILFPSPTFKDVFETSQHNELTVEAHQTSCSRVARGFLKRNDTEGCTVSTRTIYSGPWEHLCYNFLQRTGGSGVVRTPPPRFTRAHSVSRTELRWGLVSMRFRRALAISLIPVVLGLALVVVSHIHGVTDPKPHTFAEHFALGQARSGFVTAPPTTLLVVITLVGWLTPDHFRPLSQPLCKAYISRGPPVLPLLTTAGA